MDGTLLQAKINGGFGKAAQRIGLPFDVFRPNGTATPLAPGNKVATLPAAFAVHSIMNFSFGKPSDFETGLFHGLFDASAVRAGDYLSGRGRTFFVAALDPIVPPLCVSCERTLTVTRAAAKGIGEQGYGGSTRASDVPILTGWPGSLLAARIMRETDMLPGDAGHGTFDVLLPITAGAEIRSSDVIIDDMSRRYVVQSAQATAQGWKIVAKQAAT